MALQNSSALYTQNQGIFDSRPYLQYQMQREARKQAKEDALNKYYEALPNTINEKGTRDQEVPLINQAKDQLSKFWITNRADIIKGNTPAAYNYQKMLRDTKSIATMSQNETQKQNKLYQLLLNPKNEYVKRNPEFVEVLRRSQLPVNDPEFQALDIDKITLPPAPFDPTKHIAGIKVKPNDQTPRYEPIVGDNFNKLEVIDRKLSPADLNAVHIYAQTKLDNDYSFETHLKEKVKGNKELAANLEKISLDNYGHGVLNDGDLAAAYTLSLIPDAGPKQRTVPAWQARADYKFGQRVAFRSMFPPKSKEADNLVNDVYERLDGVLSQQEQEVRSKSPGDKRPIAGRINALPSDVAQNTLEQLRKIDPDVTFDNSFYTRESPYTISAYRLDENNKMNPSAKYRITTISRVGTNYKPQPGKDQKLEVIKRGEPGKSASSTKSKSNSGPVTIGGLKKG